MSPVSELLFQRFGYPVLCRCKMPQARGMAAYLRNGYGAFRQPKFECGCCELLFFRVWGVRHILYVFYLYRTPDLDNRIFDYLLTLVAAVQAEDAHASFLFVGDFKGHHHAAVRSRTVLQRLTSQLCSVAISRFLVRTNSCTWWNT